MTIVDQTLVFMLLYIGLLILCCFCYRIENVSEYNVLHVYIFLVSSSSYYFLLGLLYAFLSLVSHSTCNFVKQLYFNMWSIFNISPWILSQNPCFNNSTLSSRTFSTFLYLPLLSSIFHFQLFQFAKIHIHTEQRFLCNIQAIFSSQTRVISRPLLLQRYKLWNSGWRTIYSWFKISGRWLHQCHCLSRNYFDKTSRCVRETNLPPILC